MIVDVIFLSTDAEGASEIERENKKYCATDKTLQLFFLA
jgi:hypothetical protein